MQELYDLEPAEVSLVSKGANKKKFLIFKSAGGKMPSAKEMIEQVRKANPEVMEKIDEILKAMPGMGADAAGIESLMDPRVAMALKAVARILLPFKDQITIDQIDEVLAAIGVQGMDAPMEEEVIDGEGDEVVEGEVPSGEEGDIDMEGEEDGVAEIDKGHMEEAMKAADCAYKETMEKLGYEKYPTAKMSMKKMKKVSKNNDTQEGLVEKTAILKADGSLDLSAVPEAVRPAVELIYKGQQDAVKKAADLETQLKTERDERVNKELVAKADSWQHLGLPKEDVVASLKEANSLSKESFERVCKNFDTLNKQGKESTLFKELGSNQEGKTGGGTTWESIEKSAMAVVEKSGEKVSKEAAVEKFLQTKEGQRMYGEYKNERGGI